MDWKDQENKIKAKLEQRRIQPEEELWNRLDKKLGVNESRTSNAWKWAVAAVVLLGLLIGGILRNQPINEEAKISKTTPAFDKSTENKKESSQFSDDALETQSVVQNESPDKKSLIHESSEKVILKEAKDERSTAVAYSENEKEEESEGSTKKISDELEQQLVASEDTEDSLQQKATTDEVEVLLREALYKEFLAEIDSETDSTNIVAYGEKLLKEVNLDLEREEDRAFRDKIKDAIHKGWNKAKSAVAINPGNQ